MNNEQLLDIGYRYHYMNLSYKSLILVIKSLWEPNKKIKDFEMGEDKDLLLELLQVNLVALNSIIQKEKYIINKKELNAEKKLIEEFINEIATTINEDGSFVVCDKKFKNYIEFFNVIRNKLAHGSYKYLNALKLIVMEIDNKDFFLSYEWLRFFNDIVLCNIDKLLVKGKYRETIVINDPSFEHINSFKQYKNSLKQMKYLDFEVELLNENDYQQFELVKIAKMIRCVLNKINVHQYYDSEIDKIKKYCSAKQIKFECKKKFVIGPDTSEEVIKGLYNIYYNNSSFNSYDSGLQSCYIAQSITNLLNVNDFSQEMIFGIATINDFVDYVRNKNLEVSLEEYILNENSTMNLIIEKVLITLLINGFNLLFNYNMEEVYNDYLDYGKLDLNLLDEKINFFEDLKLTKIENMQSEIMQQLTKAYKDRDNIEFNLNKLVEARISYGKIKPSVIDNICNQLLRIENKIKNLENKLLNVSSTRKDLEYDIANNSEYYKNKNIINHIRNSIGHGNFEFYMDNNCKNEINYIIDFKDIYKDKVTYEATINIQELYTLIRKNRKVINQMFMDVMEVGKENIKKQKKVLSN